MADRAEGPDRVTKQEEDGRVEAKPGDGWRVEAKQRKKGQCPQLRYFSNVTT